MSAELLGGLSNTKIKLSELILDKENIRFIHLAKLKSDKQRHDQIWKENDTKDLYRQISSAKGIYEDLIIDKNNVVKEGNRRLVCLRELQKQVNKRNVVGVDKIFFDNISCKVIPKNATKKQIDLFLATIHVKGKKKWNAFNKAQLIHDLRYVHKLSDDQISDSLTIGKIILNRLIEVFIATKKYGEKYTDDNGWYHKFTYFDEFYKKRDLAEFRKNPKNIEKFVIWLRKNKFADVRDVRYLGSVIQNKHALQRFEDKTMYEARKFLEPRDPTMVSKEFRRIQRMTDVFKYFPRAELAKTVNDKPRMKLIQNLKNELDSFIEELENMKTNMGKIPVGL